MKQLSSIPIEQYLNHQHALVSSVRLQECEELELFQMKDIKCFKIRLSAADLGNIYTLWDFMRFTNNNTCCLGDLIQSKALDMAMERLPQGAENVLDLSQSPNVEPLFISEKQNGQAPLVCIDGNHRLTAHYLRHQSVEGVNAYLAVHKNMRNFQYVPPIVRALHSVA